MDQLFAPWRIEWVEREDDDSESADCVFCSFADRSDDREIRVVARSEHAFVLLNNYPYSPGHAMVIPHVHTGDFAAVPDDVLVDHVRLQQRAVRALRTAFSPDGFNIGYNLGQGAGGSIDEHVHAHVVPRWEGDTNFMPVISDTNVIVEALDDSWERLRAAFAEQDGVVVPDEDDRAPLISG